MQKIFLRNKRGKVVAAPETPFKTEDEFERFVISAKEILSGIFILKRQVRAGRDIPDIVGVDQDNNAVIIENKNTPVDESILPQITRYAVWADTHQDAIRAWWLEAKDRPDDIEIDWDHLEIRLVVLAPSIKPIVLRLVKKFGYPVDFIEIKRFNAGADEIILVSHLESQEEELRGATQGKQVYDKDFYKKHRNPRSVDAFFDFQAELEKIVAKQGWELTPKFNAHYTGFYHGFRRAFVLGWIGTKSFEVWVILPRSAAARAKRLCPYSSEYDGHKWFSILVTDKVKPKPLTPLLQLAYDSLVRDHPTE